MSSFKTEDVVVLVIATVCFSTESEKFFKIISIPGNIPPYVKEVSVDFISVPLKEIFLDIDDKQYKFYKFLGLDKQKTFLEYKELFISRGWVKKN